mmetsp:Transcript_58186/g.138548  ORF Transcript_58186/g.138548 Transcript_58186/m.138548 type:complete len:775 (+) Transcript_58186:136-2460(+)
MEASGAEAKEPEKKEPEAAEAAKEPEKTDGEQKPQKKDHEAEMRKRRAEKKKKLKEKKKEVKKEEAKKNPQGAKGKGKTGGKIQPKGKSSEADKKDEVEIEWEAPEILGGMEEEFEGLDAVKERFKHIMPGKKSKEKDDDDDDSDEDKPRKRNKPKASLMDEADDSDEEFDQMKLSKKKRRLAGQISVAELKTLVKRPDVVEVWDTTATDPRLLVYLKAYRNTCAVPRHWNSKRKYMAGKRGVEKPPFKLPEYIEATGIAKIRQAIMEKHQQASLKQKNREKVHPKMGKLDIDYQVLHDAFFKFSRKAKLSKHNDLYYEGKETEVKMLSKRPGQLSAALKEALGMEENSPPPWLINMQRYGPPPAYPSIKIPGLNAPIPQGAEYGFHTGGWGKPPVDEYGNPLYGDWKQDQPQTAPEDTVLWGEIDEDEEEEEDDEEEGGGRDGAATPMLGTSTPLVGSGSATPVVSMEGGVRSISGVSSITSGMETPGTGGARSKKHKGGIESVSGISSASLTPTPQLFQVLEEQKARTKGGMFPSANTYKMKSRGSSTPIMGVGSSGTGTPVAGIGTPIAGIGTPHGISTPHGIGTRTPGTGTPGVGTRTPHGISTPVGIAGVGTPGIGTHTPHGIGGISTPVGGIATPVGGIATPVGGIATPVGGIATPVGGIATPVGGIATPVGGVNTPAAGIATPTGIPGGLAPTPVGGADTPGPVTMTLNPQDVEAEGILTADIIRQQLKQHEEAAAKAKQAAGQKEVDLKPQAQKAKKKKEKQKFKF